MFVGHVIGRFLRPRRAPKPATKPGPKPETLDPFGGTFEQAIDKALGKKKPAGGWPKVE